MRDGTLLSALLIRPRTDVRVPAVVVANGYTGIDPFVLPGLRLIASDGFAVILARLRGVPPSEGTAGLYAHFDRDGYDLIEWAAAQPHCDGQVAMVGSSLVGFSQWQAARTAPPSLKVIVPDDSLVDPYNVWHTGGMAASPGRLQRKEIGGAESEYDNAMAHPYFDTFWEERTITPELAGAIAARGIKILMTAGWDSYLNGNLKVAAGLNDGFAKRQAKLIVGPWTHNMMLFPTTIVYETSVSDSIMPRTGIEYQRAWLNRWLRDEKNGIDEEPPVSIWIRGAEQWRFEQSWPLHDQKMHSLFLSAAPAASVNSLNDGSLVTTGPEPGVAQYSFAPATSRGIAAISSANIRFVDGQLQGADKEQLPEGLSRSHGRLMSADDLYDRQALTWTSAPLAAAAEITGYARAHFWAEVSSADADFVLELLEVGRGEPAILIARAFTRAGHILSNRQATAISPDVVQPFEIELSPAAHVVPAGRRLMLRIQGAALDPSIDVSWQGPGLSKAPFTFKIHVDAKRPSVLQLPVIGEALRYA